TALLLAVNSPALPRGSTCGHRWLTSPSASDVIGSACPPADDTRSRLAPDPLLGENRIVPPSLHAPPRPFAASQSVAAAPPVTEIFFSLPPAKNAIHRPSGEKNGLSASSVPDSAVARRWVCRRPVSCQLLP